MILSQHYRTCHGFWQFSITPQSVANGASGSGFFHKTRPDTSHDGWIAQARNPNQIPHGLVCSEIQTLWTDTQCALCLSPGSVNMFTFTSVGVISSHSISNQSCFALSCNGCTHVPKQYACTQSVVAPKVIFRSKVNVCESLVLLGCSFFGEHTVNLVRISLPNLSQLVTHNSEQGIAVGMSKSTYHSHQGKTCFRF